MLVLLFLGQLESEYSDWFDFFDFILFRMMTGKFYGCLVLQCPVRPTHVILLPPRIQLFLGLLNGEKPRRIEAFPV